MPEITVTETQRETLEAIQSDLETAYIDTYGQIRRTDVVQYLLDTYTPPAEQSSDVDRERIATAEFQLLQEVAADVEGVPGSGIDTETMRGELLSALGVEEFAARLADLDVSDTDADADSTDAESTDGADTDADADAEEAGQVDGDDAPTDESSSPATTDTDDDTATTAGSPPDSGGPSSVLSAANQLLDTHDDKWRKGGGEAPYEVDLPDGTTEDVRTKDDIRGLLFKHY